jgi:Family of unknown function (DUF5759)
MLTTPEQMYLQRHLSRVPIKTDGPAMGPPYHGGQAKQDADMVRDGSRLVALAGYIASPDVNTLAIQPVLNHVVLPPQNQVNVAELRQLMQQKDARNRETFRVILERIYRLVRRVAGAKHYACSFEVPLFIPSQPMYDIVKCIEHVVRDLTANGYAVQYIYPRTILISWAYIQEREEGAILASIARLQEKSIAEAHSAKQAHERKMTEEELGVVASQHTNNEKGPGPFATPMLSAAVTHPPTASSGILPYPVMTTPDVLQPSQGISISTLDGAVQKRSRAGGRGGEAFKDIAQFKPSGKFVLNM